MSRRRGFALLAATTTAAAAAASTVNNPVATRSLCCRHHRSAASLVGAGTTAFGISQPPCPEQRPLARRVFSHSMRARCAYVHARHRWCGDAAPLPFGSRRFFPFATRSGSAGTGKFHQPTSLGLEPGRGRGVVSISDSFDGGNIEHVGTMTDTGTTTVRLRIKPDPFTELEKKNHFQYFSFRATFSPPVPPPSSSTSATADDEVSSSSLGGGGNKTSTSPNIRYMIENAGECSYAPAWVGTTVFASRDRKSWRRILNTSYDPDAGCLSWTTDDEEELAIVGGGGSVYYAYFPPYSYERHMDLISRCAASGGATVRSLGQTLDGREVDCVTVGTGSTVAWVIHRQHPGETMAEYFAEGLLSRLLGLGVDADGSIDGLARRARELFTFHIVPNMCPDGGVRGHLRTNACGANLNREWAPTTTPAAEEGGAKGEGMYEAPTLHRSPEVYHVLAEMDRTGVDLFADCHGDEELPFNFLAGSEGCPNWGDRLRALHGAFLASYCRANGDMQRDVSYDPDPPGGANMAICSNQIGTRFDCLAFTLEMPFKDCLSNPDPERGWNPERARRLGASFLDAAVYVQQYLRCEGAFWESLPAEDAYIRPGAKY